MSIASYVIFVTFATFFAVAGVAVMLRPTIYTNLRWVREIYNPKWLESKGYHFELRVVALVFALFGLDLMAGVLSGANHSTFAQNLRQNLHVATVGAFLCVWTAGVFAFVLQRFFHVKIPILSGVKAEGDEAQNKRESKIAVVLGAVFLAIVGLALIFAWVTPSR